MSLLSNLPHPMKSGFLGCTFTCPVVVHDKLDVYSHVSFIKRQVDMCGFFHDLTFFVLLLTREKTVAKFAIGFAIAMLAVRSRVQIR